ncbi:MAG: polysaccharide biosynthesis/export family protein [bacterium]
MFPNTSKFVTAVALLLTLFNGAGLAQEYKIEPLDKLQISFWEDKDLNTETKVKLNGEIVLPVIGAIRAAGLTPAELGSNIAEKMSRFGKLVSNVNVAITEFGSKRVFVTGEVKNPGKYSFEVIPNVWEILQEAGGPTSAAMLDQVVIVRREGGGEIIEAQVASALESGELNKLPKVRPGDTINVPGSDESGGGSSSPLRKRQVVYVFGAVGNPGPHFIEKDMDILEALVKAGGPTNEAKLDEVTYVSKVGKNPTTTKVNVKKYLEKSVPNAIKVNAGDSIYVPANQNRGNSLTSTLVRVTAGAVISTLIITTIAR